MVKVNKAYFCITKTFNQLHCIKISSPVGYLFCLTTVFDTSKVITSISI